MPALIAQQASSGVPIVLILVLVFAALAVAYLLLKFERKTPIILGLLAIVALLGLNRYRQGEQQRATQAAHLAQQHALRAARQAEIEAIEIQRAFEEFQKPRIKLDDADVKISNLKVIVHNDAKGKSSHKDSVAKSTDDNTPRPDWVDKAAARVGNVYRKVVVSDPFATADECYKDLQLSKFREVIDERLDELAGEDRYRPELEQIGLGSDFVWRDVCLEDEWVETLETSFGEMKRVHALMEFDAAVNRQMAQAYQDFQRQFRIREVGGLAGMGLGSLALLFGLLKVDTWTKGYYTKRLFFGVPATIIGLLFMLFAA